MASLFRLLFDTMGFSGAVDAAGETTDSVGVGTLSDHIQFIEAPNVLAAGLRHQAPAYSQEALSNVDPQDWDIWSFTISGNAPDIEDVTCRVRDDAMKEYVVFTKVEYGCAGLENGGAFRREVDVTAFGKTFHLPLEAPARLACFATVGCENSGLASASLWPLLAKQDVGVVQVFVYDLDILTGNVTPLTMLPPGHQDIPERDKFMEACRQVSAPNANQSPVPGVLFTDNLWKTVDAQIAGALGSIFLPDELEKVVLSATSIRVAVICSLTPCKERWDFQPGRPGGVGRIYPHIMVRATTALDNVLAAVRLSRPSHTTIKGGLPCGCDEMEGEIGALYVADANESSSVVASLLHPPYWDVLFNYYLPVESASAMIGRTVVCVKHDAPAETFDDAIVRKGEVNASRVTRVRRQGAFDNIHMAPRMRLGRVSAIRNPNADGALAVDDGVREKWKLDNVVMAPFCAHDCLHMHWRWLENGEPGTFGWGSGPGTAPGQPMVAPNQDVRVRLDAANTVIYEAQIFAASPAEWQVVCHHGAAYALHVGPLMEAGRAGIDASEGNSFTSFDPSNVTFYDEYETRIRAAYSWAVFYWTIRYFIYTGESPVAATPNERVAITDLERILKVGP